MNEHDDSGGIRGRLLEEHSRLLGQRGGRGAGLDDDRTPRRFRLRHGEVRIVVDLQLQATPFAVVVHLRGRTGRGDYVGLGATQPLAALALAFLSLVGIPLLAGFLLQKQ